MNTEPVTIAKPICIETIQKALELLRSSYRFDNRQFYGLTKKFEAIRVSIQT